MTREEQVAWESERKPRAAVAAVAAALLPVVGSVVIGVASKNLPAEATSNLLFAAHHGATLIGSAVLSTLGSLALIPVLLLLQRAARFRRPKQGDARDLLDAARPLIIFGGIATAVVALGYPALLYSKGHTFATHGSQTFEQAKHLTGGGLPLLKYLGQAAALALAFSFVIVSLNVMRVGLLTRFMGMFGIIVGVLSVLPLVPGVPPPVLQAFWLGALALLLSGRWPNTPPAWASGRAEPWPTQQELREQREASGGKNAPAATSKPVAATAEGTSEPTPAKRKRKRKKRR
ncbi:MAG TPA: hypothetical protein VHE14_02920 [Solirubrobacteraceae bacterium]|nr:hypothetical protein [Solirubrobacteraceae bacterium]